MKKITIMFVFALMTITAFSQQRTRKQYIPWLQSDTIANTHTFIWRGDTIDFDAFTSLLDEVTVSGNWIYFYKDGELLDSAYFDVSQTIDTFRLNGTLLEISLSSDGLKTVDLSTAYMPQSVYDAAGITEQLVGINTAQTITNKTLTTPTIGNFSNANHNHSSTNTGGLINSDNITEGTTNLFSPFLEGSGNVYLNSGYFGIGGTPLYLVDIYGTARIEQVNIANSIVLDGLTITDVIPGTSDNQTLTTKGYVDDAIELAGGYTDEQAQDAVGGTLDNGTLGDVVFTYDDATPKISGVVENDSHDHTATTISGLTTADFTSATVSQWTNDANYVTNTFALTNDLSGTLASPQVADDSHNHIISNVDALSDSLAAIRATANKGTEIDTFRLNGTNLELSLKGDAQAKKTVDVSSLGGGSYLPLAGGTMTGNILMTSNKLIGGSTTTSDLNLQTTTGVGTTGADMHFLVGNNGATEAMTITNAGKIGFGNTNPYYSFDFSKTVSTDYISQFYNPSSPNGSGVVIYAANSALTVGNHTGDVSLDVRGDGSIIVPRIANATTSYVLYVDPTNYNNVTYGAAPSGSGSATFLGLTDTPSSYTGQGLKAIRVNSAANAIEFYTPSTELLTSNSYGVYPATSSHHFAVGTTPTSNYALSVAEATASYAADIYNSGSTGGGLQITSNNTSSSAEGLTVWNNANKIFRVINNGDIYMPKLTNTATDTVLYISAGKITKGLKPAGEGSSATNLAFSGSSSPVTLTSDTGTDVVFTAGTNVTLSQTGNNLTIAATSGTGGDNISVDGVAVVDPNYASTGDIDFVNTSNTVTANINSNAVTNAKMADDAVGIAELSATGTASSSTYLRGDNSWAAITTAPTNADYLVGTANAGLSSEIVVGTTPGGDLQGSGSSWSSPQVSDNSHLHTISNVTALTDTLNTRVRTTGAQTIAGIKTFSSFPVTPSSAPTTDYQVTNKKYVDDAITAAGGYTNEMAQDASASMITGATHTGISASYNDASNTLALTATDASASNEGSLTVGTGTSTTSIIASNTSGSTSVTIEAGSGITLAEAGNTITINSTGGTATPAGSTGDIQYNSSGALAGYGDINGNRILLESEDWLSIYNSGNTTYDYFKVTPYTTGVFGIGNSDTDASGTLSTGLLFDQSGNVSMLGNGDISTSPEVYGTAWNGSNEVPTKNDVYDKMETIATGAYTEGEGIDISSGVISGEDATTVNKGIASFSSTNFSTTSGAVSIAAGGVQGSNLNTNVISGQTELASGLVSTDELMVSDAGVLKRMDVSVLSTHLGTIFEPVNANIQTHITNDADLSATNEIQNLSKSKTGNNVTISISSGTGTTFSVADSDSSATNEIQNLSYTASTRVLAIDGTGSTDATLPLFTSTDPGLVPLSGGGTTKYLRADGTWVAPPAATIAINDLTDAKTNSFGLFLGSNSGDSDDGDNFNLGIGEYALNAVTSGFGNVALGVSNLYLVTTGGRNTAIGTNANYSANTTTSNNTSLGFNTLYLSYGADNTAIGSYAGDHITSGTDNVVIGKQTGDNLTTGSQNIIIGSETESPSATANGQIAIGNLIYGTGATGTGTTVSSSGKVGIKNNAPTYELDVTGKLRGTQQINTVNAIADATTSITVDASLADVHTVKLTSTGSVTITINNAVAGSQGTIFIYNASDTGTLSVTAFSDNGSTGLEEITLGTNTSPSGSKFSSVTYTATGVDENGANGNDIFLVYGIQN